MTRVARGWGADLEDVKLDLRGDSLTSGNSEGDDTVLSSLRAHGQVNLAVMREACPEGLEASWSSHTLSPYPQAGCLTPAMGGGLGCPSFTPSIAQRPDAETWSPGH